MQENGQHIGTRLSSLAIRVYQFPRGEPLSGNLEQFSDSAADYLRNRLDEATTEESQLLLEEFVSAFCEDDSDANGEVFPHTHPIQEWLFAAALMSSLVGMVGLYVSVASQRNQLAVQIMLQYSEKFRSLLLAVPAEMLSPRYDCGVAIEPSPELTPLALSLFYLLLELNYLREKHYLPVRIWNLWLPTVRVGLKNPFFLREWELLRPDFLHHPSFCRFIASLQK